MKHQLLSNSDLVAQCSVCGKRKTLLQELLDQGSAGYVPLNQEECEPNTIFMYPSPEQERETALKQELADAFKELSEAFPDGSPR